MKSDIQIRKLEKDDAAIISAAFAKQGWHKPIEQYQHYFEESQQGERIVLLAFIKNDFAGYITLLWRSRYPAFQEKKIPEIVDLNVLKNYHKRGIATALIDAIETHASQRSPIVGLGVGMTADYGAAQRLYSQRGYIPDGRGLHHDSQPLHYGAQALIDDDLVLYLTKDLSQNFFDQTVTFLHANDLDATSQFYENILKLSLVRDQGVCRIYKTSENAYLGFCTHLETTTKTGIILTLVTPSVDMWYETLRAKGVEIVNPPAHNPKYQIYHFFFKDPNGYTLEIQRFDEPLA